MGKQTGVDILTSGISRRAEDQDWQTLIRLVRDQRLSYDFYLLNNIGHGNPIVLKRETLAKVDAEKANETLNVQISELLQTKEK
ncbi:MAG: hypothetical protein O3C43_16420 [Verrucomicrobia bacterium]|nr:hypothetical protein [Verrucomicrobiota bacterium]